VSATILKSNMAFMLWIIVWWTDHCATSAAGPAPLETMISHDISVMDAAGRTVVIQTPVKRVVAINTAAAIIMRALGIRWLYLDCNDPQTLDQDIRILGRLFGKEKKPKH
jgi:ABC-type Fe3+-hydroxamate transport system substrate-binding protein